ncbi:deoxyribodipyrimidine photo-lyase [Gadus macrocephalus]|uniref:deoxyribodipyrimidine photo-lyase n=1 Tax=Gadus macrocephalus TaxID=80720 RepID=UPI0028CB95E0|nr:deoxyribodipyrimidine photo-lyase [Gadus macrocephalus]
MNVKRTIAGAADNIASLSNTLQQLVLGGEDPGGFFGICVSAMGHSETLSVFPSLIQPLASVDPSQHSTLIAIYVEYFSKDEEDELEVALALSLLDVEPQQKPVCRPEPRPPVWQGGYPAKVGGSIPGVATKSKTTTLPGLSYAQSAATGGRGRRPSENLPRTGSGVPSSTPPTHPSRDRAPLPTDTDTHSTTSQTTRHKHVPGLPAPPTFHQSDRRQDAVNDDARDPLDTEGTCPDQSQKPKRSKNRRQRGKGCGQRAVVGLPHSPSATPPVLLWLRRDLRLHDNPALIGSLQAGAPVVPVFIWSPEEEEGPGVTMATGGACRYWLHQALACLQGALGRLGSHLVLLKAAPGSSLGALLGLAGETGARTVLATALYEPWLRERDQRVEAGLRRAGVAWRMVHSYCLRDPYSVSTQGVGLRGLGSVSHFISCCEQNPGPALGPSLDPPVSMPTPSQWPPGDPLDALGLARMPRRKDGTVIDWAANIRASWDFSEQGAHARLEAFLQDGVYRYEKESGRADSPNTSCLSPYLHWGQISPRWLLWDAKSARCRPQKFQRKLAWRDLAYWQLSLFPALPWESLRPAYKALRWSSDRGHLKAWQRGRTGYPLVDAAMRQLWLTGWVNNYMRHVVASFLIAYLHLPWQEGYLWFQDTLLDADVAIDAMMWQNGGMCGLDHWNFVMHPVDAALTCDPCGSYVRKWCPELAALPDDIIHKPWRCPASILRRAGVAFGHTYPEPIVTDLEARRGQSLQDVALVRSTLSEYVDERSGCDLVPLPPRLVAEALGSAGGDQLRTGTKQFLLPVITRMEFKHRRGDPGADAASNPYDAVLKGYVSRKRDETVAFLNQRDFSASVMNEGAQRRERLDSDMRILEGLPRAPPGRGRARPTPAAKGQSS